MFKETSRQEEHSIQYGTEKYKEKLDLIIETIRGLSIEDAYAIGVQSESISDKPKARFFLHGNHEFMARFVSEIMIHYGMAFERLFSAGEAHERIDALLGLDEIMSRLETAEKPDTTDLLQVYSTRNKEIIGDLKKIENRMRRIIETLEHEPTKTAAELLPYINKIITE